MPDYEHSSPSMDRWHVSKTINITHLVTTASMIFAAMWYVAGQDNRISQAELNIKHLQSSRIADQASAQRQYDEFRTDLRSINAKLDRLIEYQSRDSGR